MFRISFVALLCLQTPLRVVCDECRDFPRYDGQRYTGAELYTCSTYCQAGWCTEASYNTPKGKGDLPPVYVDGVLGLYFTIDNVKRNPKNMTEVPDAWDSAAYYFSKGYHYDYWDGELVSHKLNSTDPIWNYTDTAGPPPPHLLEHCQNVSKKLGRTTYIADDGWKFCKDFPEHLKNESRNITFPDGTVINPYFWWEQCKIPRNPDGSHNTYWWTCKVSDNNTMLWDANVFGADPTDTTDTNLITWAFNLPWDVACCCCGGGTKVNQPGGKMVFKIEKEYPDIAAKLTPANFTNLDEFLQPDGLYINTTAHADWTDVLYPTAKATNLQGGLIFTFPNVTYPADIPPVYKYDKDVMDPSKSECQDLKLDLDLENYTLSYSSKPSAWLDWSGYPCRFYAQDACANGGPSQSWNSSGWGPLQFFYNGHVKQHVNGAKGHGPKNSTILRAHAGNVCCACGGGQISGYLVKPTDDFDYDANNLDLDLTKLRTGRWKLPHSPRMHSSTNVKQREPETILI
jgi:hypothetical protein